MHSWKARPGIRGADGIWDGGMLSGFFVGLVEGVITWHGFVET